ncbi:hypothetical protein [Candidatus Palauibacter sp.]|uniref:hypothetical protein n=1 Tax=Candidatus Palauibacter sp. TaxID=3101350 RepID=UPI003AF28269
MSRAISYAGWVDWLAIELTFASQVPNFERALSSFSLEEQSCFAPQFSRAVTEFAQHVASAR